jgi:phage terminase small subunit
VREEVDRQIAAQQKRTQLNSDRVLQELWRLGTVDIRQAFNADGSMKRIHDIPEDVARAVAGIETDELFDGAGKEREQVGFTRKIKLTDKTRALELLGRHFKMFTDKIEVSGMEALGETLAAARKRLNG